MTEVEHSEINVQQQSVFEEEQRSRNIGTAIISGVAVGGGMAAGGYGMGVVAYESGTIQPAVLNKKCAEFLVRTYQTSPNEQVMLDATCRGDFIASQTQTTEQVLFNNNVGNSLRPAEQIFNDANTHLEQVEGAQLETVIMDGAIGGAIGGAVLIAAGVTLKIRRNRASKPIEDSKIGFSKRTVQKVNDWTKVGVEQKEAI